MYIAHNFQKLQIVNTTNFIMVEYICTYVQASNSEVFHTLVAMILEASQLRRVYFVTVLSLPFSNLGLSKGYISF